MQAKKKERGDLREYIPDALYHASCITVLNLLKEGLVKNMDTCFEANVSQERLKGMDIMAAYIARVINGLIAMSEQELLKLDDIGKVKIQ